MHVFVPDDNGIGCDVCPLPEKHPTHVAPQLESPPPVRLSDPNTLGVNLHPGQAPTSQDAALSAWPKAGTQRWYVLMALDTAEDGNTDEDLAAVLDLSLNSIRPRRGELVAAGWVTPLRDSRGREVTRPTESGAQGTVWVLTPAARNAMRGSLTRSA